MKKTFLSTSRKIERNSGAMYVKKSKVRVGVQDLQKNDGSLTENNEEKANTLADYLTSEFSTETSNDNTEIKEYYQIKIEDLHIDVDTVRKKLKKLNISKAPGPDQIHPIVIRELSDIVDIPLTILFNASILNSELPNDWNKAHI